MLTSILQASFDVCHDFFRLEISHFCAISSPRMSFHFHKLHCLMKADRLLKMFFYYVYACVPQREHIINFKTFPYCLLQLCLIVSFPILAIKMLTKATVIFVRKVVPRLVFFFRKVLPSNFVCTV